MFLMFLEFLSVSTDIKENQSVSVVIYFVLCRCIRKIEQIVVFVVQIMCTKRTVLIDCIRRLVSIIEFHML